MTKQAITIAVLIACSTSLLAQWPKFKEAGVPRDAEGRVLMEGRTPRTADNKPDLSGDWIRADRDPLPSELAGVVTARDGNTVRVRFDDGTVELRPANLIRQFDWRAGSHVECRFTDGNWYGATITRLAEDGLTMSVRYDDGDVQNTNTGRCRVAN